MVVKPSTITTTTLLPLPRPTTTVSTNNKQQQQIVGGRLRHFYHEWETVTNSSWLLNAIQHGYLIPFTQPPPLTSQPQPVSPLDSDQHQLIEQSIQDLLQQKAIKEVKNSTPSTTIQNGNSFRSLTFDKEKRLSHLDRPPLGFYPYSNPSSIKEVSAIQLERQNMGVHNSPFWSQYRTLSLHQTALSDPSMGTQPGQFSTLKW
ncbi:hypothetical protein G6F65_018661 [Rhizopus arrhizus]|nr:hypothetical protein G6F65_018661 [Rhizopus arrhizus]KAG1393686.1 hypothetical protein G6F59_014319 [Rhizopus arrhizus]